MEQDQQHVFLVGAKNFGAYGGYETFIDKLTEYHQDNTQLKYHVVCKANGDGGMDPSRLQGAQVISDHEFVYHNADCVTIKVPDKIGSAQAVFYDVAALRYFCRYIREHHIPHPIVYIMACRIGPFIGRYSKVIHSLGGKLYLNPDGHEWLRAKWCYPIRKYWKASEQTMVHYCDLAVCDSVTIEYYIHDSYDGKGINGANPCTTFIAYGSETGKSALKDDDPQLLDWYHAHGLSAGGYYLVVGRFVPENNYETMIREFMKSGTKRDFALITNVNAHFLRKLEKKLHFSQDKRIKFVGTVYDRNLLKKIRENAYAYFHGHEVGGTNPSLLEALGSTRLNLLLKVGFNQEVARDAALYWTREEGSLSHLIDSADTLDEETINAYGQKALKRITDSYSWEYICEQYRQLFLKDHLLKEGE